MQVPIRIDGWILSSDKSYVKTVICVMSDGTRRRYEYQPIGQRQLGVLERRKLEGKGDE